MFKTLKRWLGRAALACGLLAPVQAQAANTIVVDSIVTYANYHNIGIMAYYTGDDDSDAVFTGYVWKPNAANDSTTRDTLVFYDSRKNLTTTTPQTRRYRAASIMWVGQDSTIRFDLNISDPDNGGTPLVKGFCGTSTTYTGALANYGVVTTRAAPSTAVVGNQIFIGPFGDDANSGLTRQAPKRTFNSARSALTAGGQIRLMTGTYYAQSLDSLYVSPNSLNGAGPTARYSVVGDPGVVIEGADTLSLNTDNWICKDLGDATNFGYAFSFATPHYPRTIVLGDTLRLYPYQTLARLRDDPLAVVNKFGAFWVNEDGSVVIIRVPISLLPHGSSETFSLTNDLGVASGLAMPVKVPVRAALMRIESAFWRVDSLQIQHFGTGWNDVSITHGVINLTNLGSIVRNCTFQDNGRPAVAIRKYSIPPAEPELQTRGITIERNTFLTHTMGQTSGGAANLCGNGLLSAQGCSALDSTGCGEAQVVFPYCVLIETGRGHVVRWNKMRGSGDSFIRTTQSSWPDASDTSQVAINDLDCYQNDLMWGGGDNLEPDGMPGVNSRFYKNVIRGGNTTMNHLVTRGPFYFVYNTSLNTNVWILHRGAEYGDTTAQCSPIIYGCEPGIIKGHSIYSNNTYVANLSTATDAWAVPQNGSQNQYCNQVIVNNILAARSQVIYETGCLGLNTIGFNGYYILSGTNFTSTKYGTVTRSQSQLTAFRDSTYGQAKQDRWYTSLAFQDSTAAGGIDLVPKSTFTRAFRSTGTDSAGRTMPGINTNIKHAVTSWKNNTSGSSDSTYAGAWKVNGMRIEGLILTPATTQRKSWLYRLFHFQ